MFEECHCHNSSLWKDGPVDVQLCDWSIISASVPLGVLVVSLPFHLINIISNRKVFLSSNSWSKLSILRLTVTLVILILNILFSIMEPCPSLRTLLIILASLTAVLKTTLLVSVVKSRETTSRTILCFWVLTTAVYLPYIILEFKSETTDNKYFGAALIVAMVLSAVMLVLQCFAYQEKQTTAEDGYSYVGQLMFSWLDFLFKKGFRHEIPVTDLPKLPKVLNVRKLIGRFEESYLATGGRGTRKLLMALLKSFGFKFISGGFLRIVNDIIMFLSPLIIQKLLNVIENELDASDGYFWCVLLYLNGMAASLISGQFFATMYQSGFQMRTAVMAAVFKKYKSLLILIKRFLLFVFQVSEALSLFKKAVQCG